MKTFTEILKEVSNHSCSTCHFFDRDSVKTKCSVAYFVEKKHGAQKLNEWLHNSSKDNQCSEWKQSGRRERDN